jgi:hypothetical protein
MTLTEQYNCIRADLYNAERRLEKGYTAEKSAKVESLKLQCLRLEQQIRASGPTVRDIQASDGVLL